MKPSVGRIVHYVSYGTPGGEFSKECRAAVVTETGKYLSEEIVGICVLNPAGIFFHEKSRFQAAADLTEDDREYGHCPGRDNDGGTWHWPTHF